MLCWSISPGGSGLLIDQPPYLDSDRGTAYAHIMRQVAAGLTAEQMRDYASLTSTSGSALDRWDRTQSD
jgi:hypothetical protein